MLKFSNVLSPEKHARLNPWQTFSSNNDWAGFSIELYQLPSTQLPSRFPERHTLSFNVGNPVPISWKSADSRKRGICNTGNIMELVSPGMSNEVEWEQQFHSLVLSFDASFVDNFLEKENFSFRKQHNLNDPALAVTLFKLNDESSKGHITEKIYFESLVISSLTHLICNYSATGNKLFAPKGKLSSGQLRQVIDYAHACIHANLSLTQLAACVHLSPFHFARLFRQTVGISPYQFVLQMKIEFSKTLIRQHQGSLSDVAYTLSFTDQAHFSNAFKKITGICPRQFLQTNAA